MVCPNATTLIAKQRPASRDGKFMSKPFRSDLLHKSFITMFLLGCLKSVHYRLHPIVVFVVLRQRKATGLHLRGAGRDGSYWQEVPYSVSNNRLICRILSS